jgi:16S rRNA C967 or C1407 C5-methylase (RsmB/RsmF family)/NOL1/NOP2/fmu family ribosome biogenesis protein
MTRHKQADQQGVQGESATLPANFLARMAQLLPAEEFERFTAPYEQPARVGLRVNTLKITPADFLALAPFSLSPVGAFEPAAFLLENERQQSQHPGRHPYHAAGLYYLQDPSAMAAGALLAPQPGELVLDLAAAPGGKATHLASLLGEPSADPDWANEGLLVANDVHLQRARLLVENLERWGALQALVTTAETEALVQTFGPIFDRVLLDAPCSGEGMFRRREGDVEWSQAIVEACARRQSGILEAAAQLTRPTGRLLYSTCTFAPEENEGVIGRFLEAHPDFELLEAPHFPGFAPGQPDWVDWASEGQPDLRPAVRLWPHQFPGEGHFLALLQRKEEFEVQHSPRADFSRVSPGRKERQLWEAFARQTLRAEFPAERLHLAGGRLYLLPARSLDSGRLRILRYGLLLGELRQNYFRPAHALAQVLQPAQLHESVIWAAGDPRTAAYLAGQDVADQGKDGWIMVTVDGYGLGWAKRSRGQLKNHYPRTMRRLSSL